MDWHKAMTNRQIMEMIFPGEFDFDAAEKWTGGEIDINDEWWNKPYNRSDAIVSALSKIEQIDSIINHPFNVHEDAFKYKAICEVMK